MTTIPCPEIDAEPRASATRAGKPRTAKTKVAAVVCAKCAKRQGLRPRDLRALLKGAAKRAAKGATKGATQGSGEGAGGAARFKFRVVSSGCLGPCPKRAVAVATGASLAAGRVLLLDPAAGPEAALALFPEFGPNAGLGAPDEIPPPP